MLYFCFYMLWGFWTAVIMFSGQADTWSAAAGPGILLGALSFLPIGFWCVMCSLDDESEEDRS